MEHCFPPGRQSREELLPGYYASSPLSPPLSEVTSEGEEHMARSPPHLDPEETDEGRELKRLSAHLTDASVHEASTLVRANVMCRFKVKPDKQKTSAI